MTFQSLLAKYRKQSFSERDKGDRFERLMQAYLKTDPKYVYRFKNVWLWNEFPGRKDLGGKDSGIDLVAQTNEGDYWAIQCKCFLADATIDKNAVDSFLSTSSREFKNDSFETVSFSQRLWISTTNKWGANADEAIRNQNPPVSRINLYDLEHSPVDWEALEQGITGDEARTAKKEIKAHQQTALDNAHNYFKTADRGKLIMACGTGKTFTSLRIAENETDGHGLILFLVPSIALLGQTLRAWTADAKEPINPLCICSDPKITRKHARNEDSDSTSVLDLALPATTDVASIVRQFRRLQDVETAGMTVVFSTYQSIDVIAQAQKELLGSGDTISGIFDLIICDEAHRTTGVTLTEDDSSAFVKVHDNSFIRAKKRLYMTATPRLYNDDSKAKAAQSEAVLCSMDDSALYGEEIYRIGFGEAVELGLLTDYKVLILTLSDTDIPPAVQHAISNQEHEINADDASKLIGCINALSKQVLGDAGVLKASDPEPMRRAVAFCQTIKASRKITGTFNSTTELYLNSLPEEKRSRMVSVSSEHIDGTMTAPQRDELLGWLQATDSDANECRILTNVRCLSEGVDVPTLDAVLFLSARNSIVDVVQSVGRVMRKADGKNYGYIIIPVVVPSDIDPARALDDNERYKVVWSVLNALRAHDDRFNATVNKIELNRKRPDQILVGRPDGGYYGSGESDDLIIDHPGSNVYRTAAEQLREQLAMQFQQLQSVFFARMVQRVGERGYWEQWAKNVAEIAQRQAERINRLVREDGEHQKAFHEFLCGLQNNINPSITGQEAVDMLSQHIITKPVFEALFEGYSFVQHNPISLSMQRMLDLLETQAIEKDTVTLDRFYESVRKKAQGIDNAEGKQRIIIELYDKFFKTAFPKMVEKLGIVYTPVEVVDFIIHSVNDLLKKEFGRTLADENIHILDPFTGTGTFITRLLQSGLIEQNDLERKYQSEIHANEIVLLAYYIAAVNIENAYHDMMGDATPYKAFDGICLTDTFQLGETDASAVLFSEMFPQNSERVSAQKKTPLRVIIGNPPYSKGQKSANDNAQNQSYLTLDRRVADTYAAETNATNKNAIYDSYIKAFRWSTDRLDHVNGGIIAFVSNGAWLDGSGMDGLRKCLQKEFSSIWVFNLRGNARTQGELRRKEAGNVFGGGSRTPIAITLLVKNPDKPAGKATIHYVDIGDYHNREDKLAIISKYRSVGDPEMPWQTLQPNEHGDWLNQRNDLFDTYIPLNPEKKFDCNSKSLFITYSLGTATARDSWVYSFSSCSISKNMAACIAFYNEQRIGYLIAKQELSGISFDSYISNDPSKISWNDSLKTSCAKNVELSLMLSSLRIGHYRPFNKNHLYFDKDFIQRTYQIPKLFPTPETQNLVICVSGLGGSKENTTIITDCIPDLNCLDAGTQCFPLYYYEERKKSSPTLFDAATENEHIRRDGVSDFILERAQRMYGNRVTKEDIFYYVYGILHSPEYRTRFANDLKKMLPRIPLVEEPREFWSFSKAGRELADLHINYETVPPSEDVTVTGAETGLFTVEKMRFPKKGEKDAIIYNSAITITNIPAKAYEYVVNGKSAIGWVMERYQITTHKESNITNNPNDWAKEVGNPRYILDLILSVINVSVKTVDIVAGLPELKFE
ncbi:MAG: DEAD/DEAH box helicase [Chlorobiaceae bacterium]|nr:DEAD/DEAH box helicase [Chlorobiaceae bacterium]